MDKEIYRNDYESVTSRILKEQISYDKAIEAVRRIAESGFFLECETEGVRLQVPNPLCIYSIVFSELHQVHAGKCLLLCFYWNMAYFVFLYICYTS